MWSCPKCASAIDDVFNACWKCGTSREGVADPDFLTADEMEPIEDPRYDPISVPDESIRARWSQMLTDAEGELVACYQAFSLMESKFIADQLTEQGIPAMSDTIDMQDALGPMQGNPRVYCRAEDYLKARKWLARYEANRKGDMEKRLEP
jgi:hypothetical protein